MALFESSWDTKSSNSALIRNSVPSGKPQSGKKNRRDSTTATLEGNAGGANIDLDKLLKKMTDIGGGEAKGKGKGKRQEKESGRKAKLKGKGSKDGKQGAVPSKAEAGGRQDAGVKNSKQRERKAGPAVEAVAGEKRKVEEGVSKPKSKKQRKNGKEGTQEVLKAVDAESVEPIVTEVQGDGAGELSELQKLMRKNLQGSKFRIINEKLYKSSSEDAQAMMHAEPQTYTEYHMGFRHQTKSWPTNPVDLISASLSSLPPRSIIVDLGCGDAQLAKTLVPQGLNVLSFDLVSDN
ncbi:hypothetical protein RSAG8_11728, partial [Rhizoctonia solani AG-8 WAC10335]